jgi:hypothetical protein
VLGHERELLQRGDHDGRALRERLGQLLGPVAHARDHALLVLDLVDGVLQLLVQHAPVRDHHHGVEELLVARVVQALQAVGQPRDAVALAAARRVLNQVVLAHALGHRGGDELPHHVQLVVAREHHGLGLDGLDLPVLGDLPLVLHGQVHEAPEDVEEAVPLPDALPQVRHAIALRVGRVALAVAVALVERQEERLRPAQPRGHEDLVGSTAKCTSAPRLNLSSGKRVVAVELVLPLGVLHRLARGGRLDLHRGHRQPVQQQHQVQRLAAGRVVVHLPRDHQAVGRVVGQHAGVHAVRRLERRHVQLLAVELEPVPQHEQRALRVQVLHQRVRDLVLERRPWLLRSPAHVSGCVASMNAKRWPRSSARVGSKSASLPGEPAVGHQVRGDELLEGLLGVDGGHQDAS